MRPLRSLRRRSARSMGQAGLHYDEAFLSPGDREELVQWIESLQPLWEQRFSKNHPPPPGREQRSLLRPVYWLGNWQFACLDYYRPPHGALHRCVEAEPFPPVLQRLVSEVEDTARALLRPEDVPRGWRLNTCLVNFYGSRLSEGKREDVARVGEHKDFEPGPVGSISVGERALFQFVQSERPGERGAVVAQQWLGDGSLQVFGGDRWKKHLFHRVQRVDKGGGHRFARHVEGFETRRVNLTLRYVPDEHVTPFAKLPGPSRDDVRGYVETLAKASPFFARALEAGR
jgi:DNA oxidative demethylase